MKLIKSSKTNSQQSLLNYTRSFLVNFEHYASKINEFRFYAELFTDVSTDKKISTFLAVRKSILHHKQSTNFAGNIIRLRIDHG